MLDKEKISYNKKGQRHGNWIKYWPDGRFNFMESYVNGIVFGYTKAHYYKVGVLEYVKECYYAR
jgi:antitoxin component YwqK of YwqJK toxin-antitoxin module